MFSLREKNQNIFFVLSLLLSPEIFDWIDYLGTYIMGLSFCVAAFLYVLFIVKEPVN